MKDNLLAMIYRHGHECPTDMDTWCRT